MSAKIRCDGCAWRCTRPAGTVTPVPIPSNGTLESDGYYRLRDAAGRVMDSHLDCRGTQRWRPMSDADVYACIPRETWEARQERMSLSEGMMGD